MRNPWWAFALPLMATCSTSSPTSPTNPPTNPPANPAGPQFSISFMLANSASLSLSEPIPVPGRLVDLRERVPTARALHDQHDDDSELHVARGNVSAHWNRSVEPFDWRVRRDPDRDRPNQRRRWWSSPRWTSVGLRRLHRTAVARIARSHFARMWSDILEPARHARVVDHIPSYRHLPVDRTAMPVEPLGEWAGSANTVRRTSGLVTVGGLMRRCVDGAC
jgi:hypothetical protein